MKHRNRLYVQLGRLGDVLNILPLCKRDYDDYGRKPVLMVAEKFASVLDGAGYVEPLIFRGEFEDTRKAYVEAEEIAAARKLALVCTQIYGKEIHCGEKCSSFTRESWARSPDAPAWGSLPLVFDRREPAREKAVTRNLLQNATGKPYVVCCTAGTSSPFAHGRELMRFLRARLGKTFDFVDVSAFIAHRFYDLLGILEGAHCILTVDTGLLHLAHACPSVPVVALITRTPSLWHGSAWRPQHVARYYYDETPECLPDIEDSVEFARSASSRPAIFHAWTRPPVATADPETDRRIAFASWTRFAERKHSKLQWHDREFTGAHFERSSFDVWDPRSVPYVRDVIDHASGTARDHDVIALTNADVCFTPGITGAVLDRVRRQGATFTHRWDFHRPFDRPLVNEEEVDRGEWYPGSDAFFFTGEWWRQHRDEYPDMLFGREQCDEVLRQLIKRHGGLEIRHAIYHEKHASFWEAGENKRANPGNQHNRRLAQRWFIRTGYGPNDPTWWRLP